jgi:hypothetical protein
VQTEVVTVGRATSEMIGPQGSAGALACVAVGVGEGEGSPPAAGASAANTMAASMSRVFSESIDVSIIRSDHPLGGWAAGGCMA